MPHTVFTRDVGGGIFSRNIPVASLNGFSFKEE